MNKKYWFAVSIILILVNCANDKDQQERRTQSTKAESVPEKKITKVTTDNVLNMKMENNKSDVNLNLANLGQIKLMTIGDSITQASTGANWRCFLWTYLKSQAAFSNLDFVGSQKNPYAGSNSQCADKTFDADHEGHGGKTTDYVLSIVANTAAQYAPDIALIHMGTNDSAGGQTNESTVSEISKMIDYLRVANAKVTVFVAGIIPNAYTPNIDGTIRDLNAKIATFTSQKSTANSKVVFVDHYSIINTSTDLEDKLHPNYNGHVKMAARWYQAIIYQFSQVSSKTTSQVTNTNTTTKPTTTTTVPSTTVPTLKTTIQSPRVSATQIGLVWSEVANATFYVVLTSNTLQNLPVKTVTAPWIVLDTNTTLSHFFSVFPCNQAGCGSPTYLAYTK